MIIFILSISAIVYEFAMDINMDIFQSRAGDLLPATVFIDMNNGYLQRCDIKAYFKEGYVRDKTF